MSQDYSMPLEPVVYDHKMPAPTEPPPVKEKDDGQR